MRVLLSALAVSAFLAFAPAAAQAEGGDVTQAATNAASKVAGSIDTDKAVHFATGINPADFPCARGAITKLYHERLEVANLKSYHPRRLFTWLTDQFTIYSAKIANFFLGLFSKNSIESGINSVAHLAKGGRISNPLSGMDNKIDGWIENLGPNSQAAFTEQVKNLVSRTTGANGVCK